MYHGAFLVVLAKEFHLGGVWVGVTVFQANGGRTEDGRTGIGTVLN